MNSWEFYITLIYSFPCNEHGIAFLILLSWQYWLNCISHHLRRTVDCIPLGPYILLRTLFSSACNLCCFLKVRAQVSVVCSAKQLIIIVLYWSLVNIEYNYKSLSVKVYARLLLCVGVEVKNAYRTVHVIHQTGNTRNTHNIFVGKLHYWRPLADIDVNGMTIIKQILKE
jgi:hypothetical protein